MPINYLNSFTPGRSSSQLPVLLDLMEGLQPFFTTTPQVTSEAPETVVHFQEGLPRPLTPPRPLFPSHTQVASCSSQDDKSNTKPHTPFLLTHSAPLASQFPIMQQPLHPEFPHLASVTTHSDSLAGSSTSSAAPLRLPEHLPTSFSFYAPEPTSSFSAWSSQIPLPSLLNLPVSQRKGNTPHVFRPWESEKRGEGEVSNLPGNSTSNM